MLDVGYGIHLLSIPSSTSTNIILQTSNAAWYVVSHLGKLSLLPLVGWEMSTSQSAMMLCSWGIKADGLIPLVD